MATTTGDAIGTEAVATAAQSSTTTMFTSPTTTYTRDDPLVRVTLDIAHQPRDAQATLQRCRILTTSHPPAALARSTARTTAQFRQRGLTTPQLRGRPIPISPNPISPSRVHFPTMRAGPIWARKRLRRIGLISLLIPSLQIGPPRPSLPIVQRTRPEASRKTKAAQAAAIAHWVEDTNPAEIRGHPATADKPASRGTKKPLAHEATLAAVMPNGAEAAGPAEAVDSKAAPRIEAAVKKVSEEFQWRRMK